MDKLRCIKVC